MKKYSWILSLCLSFGFLSTLSGQTVYGETIQVLEEKMKADSALYLHLSERFHKGDPSLTNRELSLLYYGSTLRPGFNPLQEERILDAMNTLARRDKYAEALSLCDNFLKKNPASLAAWLERGYTCWLMEDSTKTVETYRKYYQLLDVPMRSGTGESFEQAFVVASMRDIELVLDKLGFVIKGQSIVTRDEADGTSQHFQIVNCEKDGDKTTTASFYFNVELPLSHGMQQSLKKK